VNMRSRPMADEQSAAQPPAAFTEPPQPVERVWNLIGSHGPDVAGLGRASCSLVPGVTGIGLSAGSRVSDLQVRFTTDDTSALIEEVQLTLNEGPCRDAAAAQQPVVAADLTTEPWRQRWPQFTPAALNAGVRAVISLPLHAGGVRHEGAVDLYRRCAGGLDGIAQTAALDIAAAAAELLTLETLELPLTDAFAHRRHNGNFAADCATPINAGTGATDGSPAVLLVCWFDVTALPALRKQVRGACADRGLAGDDLYAFVLAVHEAMTNVVRHGGGRGQLLLWWQGRHLWCEIADHGPGIPAGQLPTPPATGEHSRRGLWLIRRACTSCKVTTDATGTRLLLGYRLNDHHD
jgi:anti-sigma regulatory factor (Ser/Thr protein kinase)